MTFSAPTGYAGSELVAQMSRLTDNLLPSFPNLTRDEIGWILATTSQSLMPELGRHLSTTALAVLRRRGVDVRFGASVTEVTATGALLTDRTEIACGTVIWCAGVTANPLVATLGLPLDHGRLVVNATLDVPGYPQVFAIGDAAAVPDLTSTTHPPAICPPTAQHAMRQGAAAARNITAAVTGKPQRPYRHRDLGLVVDLGGRHAVATPLGVKLKGILAVLVTRGYHLYALPTAKRRLTVLTDWALAGKHPNDVRFGLLSLTQASAGNHAHRAT
jgi:NADH dehydrogenase